MNFIATTSKYISLLVALSYFVECRNFQIVGGQLANITNTPFQVAYYNNGQFECSGSLISPLFVLTAAHCTYYFSNGISIRLGSSFRSSDGIILRVVKYVQHPSYVPRIYDYDFALLQLERSVQYTNTIRPARLPVDNSEVPVGTECTISGWGLQSFMDMNQPPEQLLSAVIQISDSQACAQSYGKFSQPINNRMICGGLQNATRDACSGDSGGPLVCNGILVGVVSFGYGCAVKNFPGVYSKISAVMPWIRKTLREASPREAKNLQQELQ